MIDRRNRPVEDLIRSQLQSEEEFTDQRSSYVKLCSPKGPVKLIQRVKIAHSFLHVMSKLFHSIILSLSR